MSDDPKEIRKEIRETRKKTRKARKSKKLQGRLSKRLEKLEDTKDVYSIRKLKMNRATKEKLKFGGYIGSADYKEKQISSKRGKRILERYKKRPLDKRQGGRFGEGPGNMTSEVAKLGRVKNQTQKKKNQKTLIKKYNKPQ